MPLGCPVFDETHAWHPPAHAAAAGALLGSSLLHVLPNGRLEGMNDLGWVTIALSVTVPSFLFAVDHRGRARERRPSPAAGTGITPSAAPRMPNG